ncbi:MAG: hypothetical protein L0H26_06135, partial [Microlunatus sp.]|nr:hypothetical protein [Microlunatus sp.]
MQRKSIWGATIAALTAGLALTGAPPAQAATVTDAVSNVQIVETTVARYAKTTVRFDWAVPDGTQPGDTFTIELPTIFS